ncbi:MAG: hypothetical protein H6918_09185 [Sphingomonadaceae bacterium]|nr:hypothetical protein [Sphingomonadaceae bacterium]
MSFTRQLCLATIALLMATQAHAQATVVRSTGPTASTNPVGKKLAKGARIKLEAKDRVTVLEKAGTRVLTGPGTFVIGGSTRGPAPDRTNLLAYVSRKGALNMATTGAVRGPGDTDEGKAIPAPKLWFLDLESSGNFCLGGAGRLIVWRPEDGPDQTGWISTPEGEMAGTVTWESGSRLKSWPEDEAPLNEGQSYVFIPPAGGKGHELTFIKLEETPDSLDEVADVLVANGCLNQLERLATMAEATLELDEESSDEE